VSAELRALLAGASPAPWEWLDGGNGEEGDELQDGQGEQVASGFRDDINLDAPRGAAPPPGHITDGRLCAAMRNEIEALLDERDAAIRRAASLDAARLAMEDRYHDLAWCNKDDDCQTKAEGARLAIEDFEDALGVEPLTHPEPSRGSALRQHRQAVVHAEAALRSQESQKPPERREL